MTELNKFGVIGLLRLHKGTLLSHAEFPFQQVQYVQKDRFFCIREKDEYIDTISVRIYTAFLY